MTAGLVAGFVGYGRVGLVSLSAMLAACGAAEETEQRLAQPLVAKDAEPELSEADAEQILADEEAQTAKQPLGRIFSAETVEGKVRYLPSRDLPNVVPDDDDKLTVSAALEPGQASPRLLADADRVDRRVLSDSKVEVVITFKERMKLPRFPEPNMDEPRDSAHNTEIRARSESLISAIRAKRRTVQDARRASLAERYGVVELERLWLVDGMLATLPLSKVRALSKHPDVQYVEYNQSDAPPPEHTIADGVALIRAEVYYDFTGSWIGLLDTGTRETHTHFNNPNRISIWKDCNQGTSTSCIGSSPGDCWGGGGHGTGSASIISGNDNLGLGYRGVSKITIDSYRVYGNLCGYDLMAGQRGFAAAVNFSDKVILGNIQEEAPYNGATATAANAAFDVGSVVIAPVGNFGPGASTARAPGNARRVLGIGAVDVMSQSLISQSGRGPTNDQRTKPDLTAPTNVFVASNISDTAIRDTYGGTSAASPFATGAAAVARNFLRGTSATIDPGQVYAYLLMSGRNGTAPATNNSIGAGLIRLYNGDMQASWGSVNLTSGSTTDIPFTISSWPAGTNSWEAAIWWPAGSTINNINLRLIKPSGSVATSSEVSTGVWEKVFYLHSAMPTGTWKLRIINTSVNTQKVYWSSRRSI